MKSFYFAESSRVVYSQRETKRLSSAWCKYWWWRPSLRNYSLKQINNIYVCIFICTKQRTTSLFLFVNKQLCYSRQNNNFSSKISSWFFFKFNFINFDVPSLELFCRSKRHGFAQFFFLTKYSASFWKNETKNTIFSCRITILDHAFMVN